MSFNWQAKKYWKECCEQMAHSTERNRKIEDIVLTPMGYIGVKLVGRQKPISINSAVKEVYGEYNAEELLPLLRENKPETMHTSTGSKMVYRQGYHYNRAVVAYLMMNREEAVAWLMSVKESA